MIMALPLTDDALPLLMMALPSEGPLE